MPLSFPVSKSADNLQYSALAECYDILNSDIDYTGWANKLAAVLSANGVCPSSLVLDLACGTGNITLPLSKIGYDMIGIDISYEMLLCARNKKGSDNILYLNQDMSSFELYGTVAGVVCCLDSINYLTTKTALKSCFSLVHNYLDPNGIFIFDVNTPYKFENIYGNNHYVLEDKNIYCGWQNYYNKKSGICEFDLSFFTENSDGTYTRRDEIQKERCWSIKSLEKGLADSGFLILNVGSDLDFSPLTSTTERAFFLCRAKK